MSMDQNNGDGSNLNDLEEKNVKLKKKVEGLKETIAKLRADAEKDQNDFKLNSRLLNIENKAMKEKLSVYESIMQ